MKNVLPFFLLVLCISCFKKEIPLEDLINNNLNLAVEQYTLMDASLPDSLLPRSTSPDGSLMTNKHGWWTSGFYPGILWHLYQFSGNEQLKQLAEKKLNTIVNEQYNDGDHDIGFKILCSFGSAWKATGDSAYRDIILTAAKTATHRFNKNIGLIRSWGAIQDTTQYLVIVDNMMNLELLFWATNQTGDSSFYNMAVSHADQTMQNHYRGDGSSYHVLNYNQKTGEVILKRTHQGYNDDSSWSRGQAWGLYGFVVCYRETANRKYLNHAKKIAGYLLNHPNLPEDGVPYWDFNAPNIPDALRDASAAAIMASAFIELCNFVENPLKQQYLNYAKKTIRTLSSPEYRAALGENNNFLLKHGVGHFPKTEVDVPLSYTDYYYIEALMRLKKVLDRSNK